MNPSPVSPHILHEDGTMPTRHYSKVFHRDKPTHCLATFCDPETHAADAEAYVRAILEREKITFGYTP